MEDNLPGFFRDPKTGKYFRDKSDIGNPSVKRMKEDIQENLAKFKKLPSTNNLLNYLKARQIRAIGGVQEVKEYHRIRLLKKVLDQEVDLSTEVSVESDVVDIKNAEFIKDSDTGPYGIWSGNYRNGKALAFGKIDIASMHRKYFYLKNVKSYVIDMCPGPSRTYIVLYNYSFIHKIPHADYFPKVSLHNASDFDAFFNCEFFNPVEHTFSDISLFCCCSSADHSVIALGGDKIIFIYHDPYDADMIPVDGNVHCLSYDSSKNLLAYGLHNGQLIIIDNRVDRKKPSRLVQVSNQILTDCAFYSSEKVIVAGANDKLLMVDLRKQEKEKAEAKELSIPEIFAATYGGHKQSVKKQSFSFTDKLLCARGSDNVVRVWDINGGAPLLEMGPLENPQNKVHGLLTQVGNETRLSYFEGSKKKDFFLYKV